MKTGPWQELYEAALILADFAEARERDDDNVPAALRGITDAEFADAIWSVRAALDKVEKA